MKLNDDGNTSVPDDFLAAVERTAGSAQPQRDLASTPLDSAPSIDPSADVRASTLGRYTEVGARTAFYESTLGDYSYIVNDGDVISTTIGKLCSIAAHVRINPGNHPIWRATSSHLVYRASKYWPNKSDEAALFEWRRSKPVHIGHDVWIGHGAVIMPGLRIGTGAVVAAGAVVTKDVGNYEIVAGMPAKLLRRRFNPAIEEALLEIAIWDWDHERLGAALDDFRTLSIEEFCAAHRP